MSGRTLGLVTLVGFALMSAFVDVIAGYRLQHDDIFAVAAISFTLVAVFFLGYELLFGAPRVRRALADRTGDVLGINAGTLLSWLPLLFALKLIEPAVANIVSIAIGPAIIVLLSPLFMPQAEILLIEKLAAGGIVVVIGALAAVTFTGSSAVGKGAAAPLVLGTLAALASGLGASLNMVYGKRLQLAGLTPTSVMAVRFFVVVGVSWICYGLFGVGGVGGAAMTGLLVAILGLGLPMYLIQFALRYVEPITASIMMSLAPIFTFLLQFFDSRLSQSLFSLICITAATALVMISTFVREQHEKVGGLKCLSRHPNMIPENSSDG